MQNNVTTWLVVSMLIVFCTNVTVPVVFAQGAGGPGGTFNTSPAGGGIKNPLEGSASSITDVLKKVINFMLGLVGTIALIALITAGARMIFGFVDEDQVKKAKTTILWAVIGLAVVILSYAIINIVTGEILGGGSGAGTPYDTVKDSSSFGPTGP